MHESVRGPSQEAGKEWDLVGQLRKDVIVYISPEGLEDRQFIAHVLWFALEMQGGRERIEIDIFDDREHAPSPGLPMTNEQERHWQARYVFDAKHELDQFNWISLRDPDAVPPEIVSTPDDISPRSPD